MTTDDQKMIKDEYAALKKIAVAILLLLVSTLVSGFGFFYQHHARISVLESDAKKGERWTRDDHNAFESGYSRERDEIKARILAMEKSTTGIKELTAGIDVKVTFLLEQVKQLNKPINSRNNYGNPNH